MFSSLAHHRHFLDGILHMLDGPLLDFYLNKCLDQRKFRWFVGGIDRSIHLILLDDFLGSSLSFAHNIVDFDHSAVHLIDINKTLNSIDKIINYTCSK